MSTARLLCRCLAFADDPGLRERLADPGLDDLELFALANEADLGPALAVRLGERGLLGALPPEAQDYLGELRRLNGLRNERLRSQAVALALRLGRIGVVPLLLKGGVFLFDGSYEDPAARMLVDLDVLVPSGRLMDCVDELRSDHAIEQEDRLWSYQFLPMTRPGDLAPVELHRDLGEQRPAEPLLLAPSPTTRVIHAIFHAEVQDRSLELRRVPLRTLVDVQHLGRRFGPAIDWELVRSRLGPIALAHLELAHQLLGVERPWPPSRAAARSAAGRLRPRAPWLERAVDLWADLTFPYKRSKIDYLYGTEASALRRQLCRLRHTGSVLARRARRLPERPRGAG
jgi:hypothetical protein